MHGEAHTLGLQVARKSTITSEKICGNVLNVMCLKEKHCFKCFIITVRVFI